MFGSTVIDIALGMALIYLLFSLISSSITETIAGWMALRYKHMRQWMESSLNDSNEGKKLISDFYAHPLIQSLGDRPSYIPSQLFSSALMDVLIASAQTTDQGIKSFKQLTQELQNEQSDFLTPELRATLSNLIGKTSNDAESVQINLEKWFDNGMERLSGWYKRHTHSIILCISFSTVLLFNVDSIDLMNAISQNQAVRASLVSAANNIQTQQINNINPNMLNKLQTANQVKIPIGFDSWKSWFKENANIEHWPEIITKILGLFISGIAISMGAPFWFDLLNKIINLRNTGKALEKTSNADTLQNTSSDFMMKSDSIIAPRRDD